MSHPNSLPTPPPSPKERRRHSRHPVRMRIDYVLLLAAGRIFGTGKVANLSRSGACFATATYLPPGLQIESRLVGCRGGSRVAEVVWCRPAPGGDDYRTGIMFT